ncbi:MAG: PD-(D/E)XK nuclease family transposase [Lachnospiraceae bacterium]|nr:PD-(D/E)XK nuclease family transposase [Lachnospiraceae bacterium]
MHEKLQTINGKSKDTSGVATVNLSDFALFLSVMKEKEAYRNVLSIILDEPDLEIIEVNVEKVILNKSGQRAIRLDAWAIDELQRQFAMEMQNESHSDFIPKRARFYQSLIDSPILKAGKESKYRDLPTTAIIFITQDDIFNRGLARYTFVEKCVEIGDLELEDGTKKIFLNMTSLNGPDELISLLQYMKDSNLDNPNIIINDKRIELLDNIVKEVKESEEWEDLSVNLLERGREQGIAQGKAEFIIELLTDIGEVPDDLREKILQENDLSILSKWHKIATKVSNITEFIIQM